MIEAEVMFRNVMSTLTPQTRGFDCARARDPALPFQGRRARGSANLEAYRFGLGSCLPCLRR
jgi:hypothetical protein